ncbi:DNA topoisomerase, partial [Stenotrophomonas maltophilia]|uniref:DNA topoisomerase n=1 Tax=Stenotrophomonas maltophilia TaxID=40324 RepID=UPI001954DAD0
MGAVESFATQPKSKSPPLPFSLSALQKACSARFGMTAQGTLEVAQALYEKHKATTYPRSDSQYLPLSILK